MQAKKLSVSYTFKVAFLVGDFMFAQSSWYLVNLESLEIIKLIRQLYHCIGIKDFANGEIKQALSLFDGEVELDEYLIKSCYKTASLIVASSKGVAVFSGVDNDINEQMYQSGEKSWSVIPGC
uniref:Putative isoprenoid synthase domain, Polyprenyl synthetase-related protein n=1 Tax=Helianthus annuus TaxID=4232 RepID=A0A251VGJ4_HELAN